MTVRHARAAVTRGVSVRDLADGMAELSVILPATVAYGIRDRLRRQAAAIRAAAVEAERDGTAAPEAPTPRIHAPEARVGGIQMHETSAGASGLTTNAGPSDTRTLAQIGADVCADLLLTATPAVDPTDDGVCPGGLGAIRGHVQVTVPVLTLLGQTDTGASIDGLTPIDPDTARRLAAQAPGWDRVLCDPVTGRYSRSTGMRRRRRNDDSSLPAIDTAERPDAARPSLAARSTTITRPTRAVPRASTTCATSACDITR